MVLMGLEQGCDQKINSWNVKKKESYGLDG
jgi:hypothetical protein